MICGQFPPLKPPHSGSKIHQNWRVPSKKVSHEVSHTVPRRFGLRNHTESQGNTSVPLSQGDLKAKEWDTNKRSRAVWGPSTSIFYGRVPFGTSHRGTPGDNIFWYLSSWVDGRWIKSVTNGRKSPTNSLKCGMRGAIAKSVPCPWGEGSSPGVGGECRE